MDSTSFYFISHLGNFNMVISITLLPPLPISGGTRASLAGVFNNMSHIRPGQARPAQVERQQGTFRVST